jgi:hypothetical protein
MSFFSPQNPGIDGLDELTSAEESVVQTIAALGTPLYYLRVNAGGTGVEWAAVSGSGDVVGPASATDNAIARYNLTTGKLIQNSSSVISDNGDITTGDASGNRFIYIDAGNTRRAKITQEGSGVAAPLRISSNGSIQLEVDDVAVMTIADTGPVTFAQDVSVPDEVYDATAWNGNLEVPTKNAIRDKIEALGTGVSDGDKGDITVSSSGTVWTIDAGTVTLAKQADVATGTIFYRKTAGAGSPEVQTLATLKTDLGLTGTNSGDQTITLTGAVTGTGTGSFATSLGSFTKAQLDTAVSDGNVLYVGDVTSNATHTGEVTGATALTVDKTAITNKTLVTAAVGDQILVADASDADNLKRVTVQTIVDLAGGGGNTFNDIYIDQSGGTSDTYGALSGTINGSNALFTVSESAYASGTLKVWLNGQLMTQGTGEDFVETTPASGTFTFNTAPATGSLITVEYQKVVTNSSTIGDVQGPASAVNNAPARFDLTSGKLIQSTPNATINDSGYYLVGGADGSAMVDLRIATDTLQGLRVEGDATDALSFNTFITGDSFIRFGFRADGTMTWGGGSGASDTNLYRSAANKLKTDDDLEVADEAYGVGWNGSLEVPTKNALYDKIETLSAGGISLGLATTLSAGFTSI